MERRGGPPRRASLPVRRSEPSEESAVVNVALAAPASCFPKTESAEFFIFFLHTKR